MGRPAVLKVDIIADAKGVGRGVDEAEGKLGRLGGFAKGAGLAIAGGLAAGALAVGAFAGASVGAASQVEQSFGAVESVFGSAARQVQGYASNAAVSLGLAKSEYAGLASVVGSQLQGMGFEQDASAVKTNELITKGADLAATFGGSVSDAVGAVGSLLRGERDPIEKYGVSITAADVAARLAEQGLSGLEGQALKNAQATATLDLLNEKTAKSSGAFSRESNTLAGQQERLRAQFENVKATVGAGLTPVLTSLFSFIGTQLLPKAQELGADLADRLGPAFQRVGAFVAREVIPAGQELFATFEGRVLPIVRDAADFFTGTLVPAFAGVAGFVVGTLVPAFGRALAPVLDGVRSAVGSVTGAVAENRPQLEALGGALLQVAGFIADRVAPVVGFVLGNAFRTAGHAIGAIIGTVGAVVGVLQHAIDIAGRAAPVIGSVLGDSFRTAGHAIGAIIGTVGAVVGALQRIIDKVREVGRAIANSPLGKVGGALGRALSSTPTLGMVAPVTGGVGRLGPSVAGLATAALGDPGTAALLGGSSGAGALIVVDRRTIDARAYVTGATDPVATARELERVQRAQARRIGRATTLTGATA